MKFRKKMIWIIILIIILLIVSFSMIAKHKMKKLKASFKPKIQTYVVKKGDISNVLEVTGEIQPISVVQLKSKVSGKIIKFYVDENDYVKQGDIIADIEPDYNQANTISNVRSSVQLAEIRLKNAKRDYNNKLKLMEEKYISSDEVTAAKDELDEAQINYTQAVDQYELVKEIDSQGKATHVLAPASGTIIQRLVQVGEMVISNNSGYGEGTVIMKLANLNNMIVTSNINEVDIDKFKVGQHAEIKVDAFPYKEYEGKVTKIAAMASEENNAKVFPIEIQLAQTDHNLRPGMTANVTIQASTLKNVLVVPIRSIFSDDKGQDIVYLVKNGAISDSVYVKTGINDLENVEIINGLKEGQTISLTEKSSTGNATFMMQGRVE
ncbi:MAG TPA: efflux RND transporter periplasmic adaptor subunit [Candidatus Cloacimonadota bacterium]|nr:efflux RND transporter periplasmic adaptor subunit [Candidatus Cloacimonadota bacterium]HPT72650.1 efflux RND transporter periplasmic adaptor subunit [Candidatus Cloacimonadota bacterium]